MLYVATFVTTILAVFYAYAKGKQTGEDRERLNQAESTIDSVRKSTKLEQRFNSDHTLADRLRKLKNGK